ncbi:DEAD/DEAH box helicase [Bifidobacterium sp. CP2]|uniref:DEAD/DEAH box helicase n=1 Tax=Bifidobacterium sp. CP2 TaxID=2809025 RepID=UPI001BDDBDBB|nr:DEAD/DEAH box helicase [Bifidobacterium sp. CP2]MBT1182198.1 DEAD/DEAH box helicase [Bifidobacterium sp. CP2]
MCECLEAFSKPTREWFRHAFGAPTEAQREAWPVIRSGADTLVIAPTGSGKTLCAFLSAIDRLMTDAPTTRSRKTKGVRVLYISPLKALAVDVAKNLEAPLDGIAAACAATGAPAPAIRIATRSGDTTPKERRAIAAHPPDILVTTPESLYLILTSKARTILRTVDTVIVDEVHALAGGKRGAHLALSLERLDDLITGSAANRRRHGDAATDASAGRPAQRIGLSATVNPPAEAARFLGGTRPVTIVDPGSRPDMDLKVVEPLADMRDLRSANVAHRAGGVDAERAAVPHISGVTPAMRRLAERKGIVDGGSGGSGGTDGTDRWNADSSAVTGAAGDRTSGSIWPVVEASVLDEILAHRTTLVFVNSRGLAEKLTARLNDLYAERRGSGVTDSSGPSGASAASGASGASDGLAGFGIPGSSGMSADKGSPEGREGFARHYDSVVGSTTMLVGSHGADDVIAMAHHGSVSKDRRKQIEERLKRGELRCVVATSSLELGIDMGSVDLVIQIAPPLSVASGLQRVGRADHRVGGVSHALFYPLTREQIVGVAASIESMRAGDIEPLAVPRNPLDILAQQTVAAAAMDDLKPDDWYAAVRRAAPFADLDRSMFDAVMGMMTGAYDTEEFSAFRPPLMWNHEADLIAARPGAQRLAVTSGGTIPDRGLYTVVLPEADTGRGGQRRVGELDEEMVYESRVGDVITLGTSTWQIQEITRDRVVVTPAPGRTARLPFWHGEETGRDVGFGRAKGRFLRETAAGLVHASSQRPEDEPTFTPHILHRLETDGLERNAVDNLARLLAEQQAATGVVPSDETIVVERCPDEEGDWRVIIHSPYGRRVHEPWAMAVTARLTQRYGFDGQAYAADDGIVIRIPDGVGEIPIRDLLLFDPDDLTRIIETQVGESVLYAARFRECAARSLFLPRTEPGRRVPLWQQRLRAAQLLNAARMRRNFPLLLETARECLQDVYDLDALRSLMTRLNGGAVTLKETTTDTPSPFAENLLFGFVGSVMYQYDVPQAERGVRLLSMDPEVLEKLLGTTDMATVLDPDVIAAVEGELAERTFWNELAPDDVTGRVTRYAKTHGPFTAERMIGDLRLDAADAVHALDELAQRGELLSGHFVDMTGRDVDGGVGGDDVRGDTRDDTYGDARDGEAATQWLHKDVFRRIRARSLAKAREAVKPVEPAAYQSFLLDRQGVGPVGGERYESADGLMRVIEQLEGVALPAGVWESSVFPARVAGYSPAMLDELLAGGEVVWVGSKTGDTKANEPGLVAFHPADSMLLETGYGDDPAERGPSSGMTIPEAILAVLASGGAYHASQLATMTRERWQTANTGRSDGVSGSDGTDATAGADGVDGTMTDETGADETVDPETGEIITMPAVSRRPSPVRDMPDGWTQSQPWSDSQFEEALWSLVWQGKVTNSSFVPMRALGAGTGKRTVRAPARASRRRIRMTAPRTPMTMGGLWSAVGGDMTDADACVDAGTPEQQALERVEILLDRYGVIAQPLIDKESVPGGFSGLYPLLKRMEEHGRLVRGMFVRGFGAAQFAEKDVVDMLRHMGPEQDEASGMGHGMNETGHMRSAVALSVLDPANLYGSAFAWPAVPKGAAKPARREGGIVVLADGRPVSYATPKSKHLTVFGAGRSMTGKDVTEEGATASSESAEPSETPHRSERGEQSKQAGRSKRVEPSQQTASDGTPSDGAVSGGATSDDDAARLRPAFAELAYVLRRGGPGTTTFADVNGEPLNARNPYARVLHQAGFTPVPQGMRLY